MIPDLVKVPGATCFTRASRSSECAIARAGPHLAVEARHGLEVVVVDVGTRGRDASRSRPACGGSRASALRSWCAARRRAAPRCTRRSGAAPPSARSSRSTDVITTWRRPSAAIASASALGLARVDRAAAARLHVAERAGARADVAEDHHRRVALRPALARFGQAASSHTVASAGSRISARVSRSRASRRGARAASRACARAPPRRSDRVP